MNKDQEAQYREEFRALYKITPRPLNIYNDLYIEAKWQGYKTGRLKGQEVKDQYVQALEEAGVAKTIEIESLKKELEVKDMEALIAYELSDVIREVLNLPKEKHLMKPETAKTFLSCNRGKIIASDVEKLRELIERAKPWVKCLSTEKCLAWLNEAEAIK